MNTATNDASLSRERPWLGLQPFTAIAGDYFFGRSEELEDLIGRIIQRPLTIFYSQSGLGKTSLLQAALGPRLREEGLLPIFVRLSYSEGSASPEAQTLKALAESLGKGGFEYEAAAIRDALASDKPPGLWLLFHDPAYRLNAERDGPHPVLIFDQFEEIFTLGARKQRLVGSLEFRDSIAAEVENRTPIAVRKLIDEDHNLAERLDYRPGTLRVLLSLREDYLHLLERWRPQLPSLANNRMELCSLFGPQAFEAVVGPGRLRSSENPIIPSAVGESIVRFVAGAGPDTPLEEIDVAPPLLSLVCAELNSERLAEGHNQVTRSRIEGSTDIILEKYYHSSFDPESYGEEMRSLPGFGDGLQRMKVVIEDRLLSPEGFRESLSYASIGHELEQGLSEEVARATLEALIVIRRLLAVDERGGVRRLELTHDVLSPVVATSRKLRRELEASKQAREESEAVRRQRNRWHLVAAVMTLLALASVISLAVVVDRTKQADRANRELEQVSQNNLELARKKSRAESQRQEEQEKATALVESLWNRGVLAELAKENPDATRIVVNLQSRISEVYPNQQELLEGAQRKAFEFVRSYVENSLESTILEPERIQEANRIARDLGTQLRLPPDELTPLHLNEVEIFLLQGDYSSASARLAEIRKGSSASVNPQRQDYLGLLIGLFTTEELSADLFSFLGTVPPNGSTTNPVFSPLHRALTRFESGEGRYGLKDFSFRIRFPLAEGNSEEEQLLFTSNLSGSPGSHRDALHRALLACHYTQVFNSDRLGDASRQDPWDTQDNRAKNIGYETALTAVRVRMVDDVIDSIITSGTDRLSPPVAALVANLEMTLAGWKSEHISKTAGIRLLSRAYERFKGGESEWPMPEWIKHRRETLYPDYARTLIHAFYEVSSMGDPIEEVDLFSYPVEDYFGAFNASKDFVFAETLRYRNIYPLRSWVVEEAEVINAPREGEWIFKVKVGYILRNQGSETLPGRYSIIEIGLRVLDSGRIAIFRMRK